MLLHGMVVEFHVQLTVLNIISLERKVYVTRWLSSFSKPNLNEPVQYLQVNLSPREEHVPESSPLAVRREIRWIGF